MAPIEKVRKLKKRRRSLLRSRNLIIAVVATIIAILLTVWLISNIGSSPPAE
jgi:hypothetical protein